MTKHGIGLSLAALLLLSCGSPDTVGEPRPDAPPKVFDGLIRTASIDLPADDALYPEGESSALLNSNCLACHSASMVMTQPVLTEDQWRGEVEKMRNVFKAPIDPADDAALVKALVALNQDADVR